MISDGFSLPLNFLGFCVEVFGMESPLPIYCNLYFGT